MIQNQDTGTLTWSKAQVTGEIRPPKRFGHSFTVIGQAGYLFGGVDEETSPPGPNNDLYILSLRDFSWTRVE